MFIPIIPSDINVACLFTPSPFRKCILQLNTAYWISILFSLHLWRKTNNTWCLGSITFSDKWEISVRDAINTWFSVIQQIGLFGFSSARVHRGNTFHPSLIPHTEIGYDCLRPQLEEPRGGTSEWAVSANAVLSQCKSCNDLVYLCGWSQLLSVQENLLLSIKEFCELNVKPCNFEIGNIYTAEIDNHFKSGLFLVFVCFLKAGLLTHYCFLFLNIGELQTRWQA